VKVGDLVHDWDLGLNGLIIEKGRSNMSAWSNGSYGVLRDFVVLYEDSSFNIVFERELEVINESR
jgi:hypothetical protein